MRHPVVTTRKGHTRPVAPESPSVKHARHHAVVGKLHGTVGNGPEVRKALSPKAKQNYDRVVKSKQSAKNARLNAEMRSVIQPDVNLTPQQGAALAQSGSKTF